MTTALYEHRAADSSERLRQRLEALGLTILRASSDGAATIQGPCRWIEQLITGSTPFAAAVKANWSKLSEQVGQAIAVWPGLWLVPLPMGRRRRRGSVRRHPPLLAAVLLGKELITSEQLRLVCEANQLDLQATISRIDSHQLVGPMGVQRLASTLAWMHDDSMEIERGFTEIQTLSQELANSYEELSLLYKLSANMTVDQPPVAFLTDACRELRLVVGLRWMSLRLVDSEPQLQNLASQDFTSAAADIDRTLIGGVGSGLIHRFSHLEQPIIVNDTEALGSDLSQLPRLARNLLVVPLRIEDQPLGILYGADKLDGSDLNTVDCKLCDSLAHSMTIFLENMMLFEDAQAMFLGTLHALTSAIDAKDSYTHGHSERVALVSRMLAVAADLNDQTIERIYLSGLVHDLGKIGVPESVLCKQVKLTKEEFDQIKLHPEIGARILRDIRQMQDLIPGVLHHHERWDGTGYPHQIGGDQVPLFGRVIGVADAFDAMMSDRTYRRALKLNEALAEIQGGRGTQFDPSLADTFLALDFQPYFQMMDQHQREEARQSA